MDREVARRLVRYDTLRAYADSLAEMEVGVTAVEVAEEFDVPEWVAARALIRLREVA